MNHRKEDQTPHRPTLPPGVGSDEGISRAAYGWLGEVLRREFSPAPDFRCPADPSPGDRGSPSGTPTDPFGVAARFACGEIEDALWYREWYRKWRRLQLPDQLLAYYEELGRARTPADVYTALSEHAVRIVGGFTCLVFPPRENPGHLLPAPNPRLRFDTGALSLAPSPPLSRAGLIAAADAESNSPFAGLAPLFSEERAVSLAHAPFGEGGVILVIERRHERVFEPQDWDLLRALSIQAEAALERIRVLSRAEMSASADPRTGLPSRDQLPTVVRHAWAAAERGEPLTLVALGLSPAGTAAGQPGRGVSEPVLRGIAEAIRQEVRPRGIPVRSGPGEILLVVPGMRAPGAAALIERIRLRVAPHAAIRTRIVERSSAIGSADELLAVAAECRAVA